MAVDAGIARQVALSRAADWTAHSSTASAGEGLTVTRSGSSGVRVGLTHAYASYDSSVTGALFEIKEDGTVIWEGFIHNSRNLDFPVASLVTAAGSTLTASLPGITGAAPSITLSGKNL